MTPGDVSWSIDECVRDEDISRSLPGILDVYREAFEIHDSAVVERFRDSPLARHRTYGRFRMNLARDANRTVIGFAYGYRGLPGRWWHDRVGRDLRGLGHESWLGDAYEFVGVAVAPGWRGRGVGGRLRDTLLGAVPEKRALLSTGPGRTPARLMYEHRGWTVVVEPFHYRADDEGFAIMGLDLEQSRPAR